MANLQAFNSLMVAASFRPALSLAVLMYLPWYCGLVSSQLPRASGIAYFG